MQEQAEIYANSQLAQALFDVLQDLLNEGSIPEELCTGMLTQLDKSILKALREEVPARAELKGHLDNYKYFDNVWKFWLRQGKDEHGDPKPVTFKLNATGTGSMKKAITVECEKMNVVCVDTKVALPGESHKS
eukprot:GHUV01005219.1.p2 GENE.GHUV01005219.1~~GHUV01005219.1.p2  ORF type:complete len:133 (+),score=40.80 GHUV01005219.1:176-574(+)